MALKKKKGSWFQTGSTGRQRAEEEAAAAKARRESRGPLRFFLKNDTGAKITYLDTPDFFLHEHNIELRGKYYNYFTCIREDDTCPLCEAGDNPSYILVSTIIDHSKYTDKEGKVHRHTKKLFVAKGKARDALLRQIKRREGDLKFCAYEIARGSGQTECSTGMKLAA